MILTFDNENWFFDIIRTFFGAIDYVVYSLLSWIVEGIFNLSNLMVDPVFVKTIYNRVYVIVGIFMVFKISFSFLQYMVSPDSMSDKEKGVGKLIVRAITMLAILVILPVIFFNQTLVDEYKGQNKGPILNVLQTGLIKTLPKVILGISDESPEGGTSTENSVTLNADEYGNFMAIKMLSSFYYPEKCRRAQEIISELPDNATDEQKADAAAQANSICSMDSDYISDFDDFLTTINMDEDDNPDTYDYQYMWPLTTIAGIALVVIMLGMAIDVAIRTFKLILLQMIAPVPVMMYIDPKGAKDGAFNSWLKMFISTYLDIFIKLGSIYILLVLVSKMFAGNGTGLFAGGFDNIQGFMSRNFVRVFLIIGLFKFAKDIPKFIKDAMGMKDSGGGGMFDSMKSLGAAAGLAGGALVGGIAGAKGGFAAAKEQGKGNGKAALSGLGSALAGMGRGGHQGFTGAGKNGNLLKGVAAASAAQGALNKKKLEAAASGSTFGGRMKARFDDAFGIPDKDELALEDAKNLDAAAANLKSIRDTAKDKGFLNRNLPVGHVAFTNSSGRKMIKNFAKGEHTAFKEAFEFAQREGKSDFVFDGYKYDMTTAGNLYKELGDATTDAFLADYDASVAADPSKRNAVFENLRTEYATNMEKVSDDARGGISKTISDFSSVTDKFSKSVSTQGADVRAGVDPHRVAVRKANKDAIKKSGK